MTLPCSRDILTQFLVQAKRATYATQGDDATVTPLLPQSRQLEYGDDALFYRDVYVGITSFVGQEIVYYENQPIWSLSYAGGLEPHVDSAQAMHPVFAFLRTALQQVSEDHPYRGPDDTAASLYHYIHQQHGDFETFWGTERITERAQTVYTLRYSGRVLAS